MAGCRDAATDDVAMARAANVVAILFILLFLYIAAEAENLRHTCYFTSNFAFYIRLRFVCYIPIVLLLAFHGRGEYLSRPM